MQKGDKMTANVNTAFGCAKASEHRETVNRQPEMTRSFADAFSPRSKRNKATEPWTMLNAERFGYRGPKYKNIQGNAENIIMHAAPANTTCLLPSKATRINRKTLAGNTNATNTKLATFSANAAETPVAVAAKAAIEYQAVG